MTVVDIELHIMAITVIPETNVRPVIIDMTYTCNTCYVIAAIQLYKAISGLAIFHLN